MRPEEAIDAVCASIRAARAGHAMLVVAIDGGAGAGKSTLAQGTRDRLGAVSILRADHFFRPLNEYPAARLAPDEAYRLYFTWERMRDEALLPLRRGQIARYQRYDWETDRLNQWVIVEPNEIVLVEGVYSTRPELRPLIDIAVFVETPRDERRKRMIARGQLENDLGSDWMTPWMAAEDWYFANVRPAAHADLVVAGI
jgi:uridine kinase